jgi:hypothetical protein
MQKASFSMQRLLTKFPFSNKFGWDAGVGGYRRAIVAAFQV